MRFVIFTMNIGDERDVLGARGRARRICELLGFDENGQAAISAEVSRMLRRSFAEAPGGTVEFIVEDAETQTLRISAGPFQLETEIHAGGRPQDQVDLWFDMNRAYLFDRATELVL